MKESIVPVKLPMNPIKMAKWGMEMAMTVVKTTSPTRKARPQTFSSPSRAHILGKVVSGRPLKKALSNKSNAA